MSDWRLQGQERYLMGVRLVKKRYVPLSAEWDHDHCAFCYAKFSTSPGDLHAGYATTDNYHWICKDCFRDFAASFNWEVLPHHGAEGAE